MDYKRKNHALYLCVTAFFSALLVGGKQSLALVPNVEVVTFIIALCAYVWGLAVAMPAVTVFILCDVAIFGVNTWVVSYVIHWNMVALVFWLLSKAKLSKMWTVVCCTANAVVLSACFGVLTSLVDTAIGYTGKGFFLDLENYFQRFSVMYFAGVSFYVTQVACNLALFAVAFYPLVLVNGRAKLRMFGEASKKDNQSADNG